MQQITKDKPRAVEKIENVCHSLCLQLFCWGFFTRLNESYHHHEWNSKSYTLGLQINQRLSSLDRWFPFRNLSNVVESRSKLTVCQKVMKICPIFRCEFDDNNTFFFERRVTADFHFECNTSGLCYVFILFWNVLLPLFHDLPWSSTLCHLLHHMHSIYDVILRHFECLLLFLLSLRLCYCTNSYAFPLMFVIAMPFYIWTLLVYINSR